MNLPGYDEWKLASPYETTAAQEAATAADMDQQRQDLRDAIAGVLHDERRDIYLADIRRIVIEELNKLARHPGEPAWQTKTPIPVPALG
jgi:methionine synthase II (cobalamin-independent)